MFKYLFSGIELASTAAQKASWTLKASSNYDVAKFSLSAIVDGVTTGTELNGGIYYTGNYLEVPGEIFPWIQVDLGESRIVKGVHLYR